MQDLSVAVCERNEKKASFKVGTTPQLNKEDRKRQREQKWLSELKNE